MKHEHTIYGFVGQSGSGKTTLILKLMELFPHLQIIKSTSTRPRRDEIDDLFYDLIPEEEFLKRRDDDQFINFHKYINYWYGTNLFTTRKTLENHCGIFAVLESAVATMRKEVPLKLIKIIPETEKELVRSGERKIADEARATIPLDYELTVVNSFKPGGLENSIKQLTEYFRDRIA